MHEGQCRIFAQGVGVSMKTLFITDLDGTLLRSDKTISKEASDILNRLISEGMAFSYATARSIYSSSVLTEAIRFQLPLVTKNGAIIQNPDWSIVHENAFTKEEAEEIYQILKQHGLDTIVASFQNGAEKYSYDYTKISAGTQAFLDDHPGDKRENPVTGEGHLLDGSVHYFTTIGTQEELWPAYEELRKKFRCICAKDTYSEDFWLEVMPWHATKADAILQLKTLFGFEKVVVFGDAVNDISMFETADECYAMENAVPELKAIATGVIGSNNEDGVARWLEANYSV